MKWISVLAAAAAFFAPASSSPVKSERAVRDCVTVYRLRVSNPSLPELDGTYFSIVNGTVGIFPRPAVSSNPLPTALQWYPSQDVSNTTWEMHVYPIGDLDHALGVKGMSGSGFYKFLDFTDPENMAVGGNYDLSWQEWGLEQFPPPHAGGDVKCVPSNKLVATQSEPLLKIVRQQKVTLSGKMAGENGRWQAFPRVEVGEWNIFWNDGTAITTANYMPIEIVWEAWRVVGKD